MCHIGGTGHVRCVEQLGGTQCVANIYITVTDGKDLVFSVDICDLMYKSVVLGTLEDIQCFLHRDVLSALIGLHNVVGHIADRDTPAHLVVTAAFVIGLSGTAAGAGALCHMTVILL